MMRLDNTMAEDNSDRRSLTASDSDTLTSENMPELPISVGPLVISKSKTTSAGESKWAAGLASAKPRKPSINEQLADIMNNPDGCRKKKEHFVYLSNIPENATRSNIYGALRGHIGKFHSVSCTFPGVGCCRLVLRKEATRTKLLAAGPLKIFGIPVFVTADMPDTALDRTDKTGQGYCPVYISRLPKGTETKQLLGLIRKVVGSFTAMNKVDIKDGCAKITFSNVWQREKLMEAGLTGELTGALVTSAKVDPDSRDWANSVSETGVATKTPTEDPVENSTLEPEAAKFKPASQPDEESPRISVPPGLSDVAHPSAVESVPIPNLPLASVHFPGSRSPGSPDSGSVTSADGSTSQPCFRYSPSQSSAGVGTPLYIQQMQQQWMTPTSCTSPHQETRFTYASPPQQHPTFAAPSAANGYVSPAIDTTTTPGCFLYMPTLAKDGSVTHTPVWTSPEMYASLMQQMNQAWAQTPMGQIPPHPQFAPAMNSGPVPGVVPGMQQPVGVHSPMVQPNAGQMQYFFAPQQSPAAEQHSMQFYPQAVPQATAELYRNYQATAVVQPAPAMQPGFHSPCALPAVSS